MSILRNGRVAVSNLGVNGHKYHMLLRAMLPCNLKNGHHCVLRVLQTYREEHIQEMWGSYMGVGGRPGRPPSWQVSTQSQIQEFVERVCVCVGGGGGGHTSCTVGALDGGHQCRMSILRNCTVTCLCHLFSSMSRFEFKKLLCHMSLHF